MFASLYAQVDSKLFDVSKGDFGVRVGDGTCRGSILYPDVVVDRQSDERVTATAMVVVEVPSPSTDLDHHIRKFARYAQGASLTTHLAFDQKTPRVWAWHRGPRLVVEQAVKPFLGKAPLPAPNRRAADTRLPSDLQDGQAMTRQEYDPRSQDMLEGTTTVVDDPLQSVAN